MLRRTILWSSAAILFVSGYAQSFNRVSSTENNPWQEAKVKLQSTAGQTPLLEVDGTEEGTVLKAWGTTFNELDWETLLMLTRDEQEEIMHNLFAPEGDLKFTRGRISMNCNDYGRSWYSCDEVQGDLELRYFNIDRDKRSIIPLIRAAQKYNPELTFWASPWSPPSWMKINNDYPVVSSRHNQADSRIDYLLFGSVEGIDEDEMKFLGERQGQFPRKLATQDYFIQDPRYLQAYANYFCKFIDAYREQGVPIDMIIYQNEAYSYTPYPGCAWTAEGTIRFNRDYLAPTLKEKYPEVKLYLGTFNSNRQDHVEKILADEGLRNSIDGVAFQWEGREILPEIRRQYPALHYICSESECGNGSMDWKAGEHTFFLISDNMGNGCDEWFNWNFLLPDTGTSPWGWNQNALIQVDSKTRTFRYTAEYYAVKHFTHYISPGSQMVAYQPSGENKTPVVVYRTPADKYVVVAGNFSEATKEMTIRLGKRYLNMQLAPHSFNTFY
ncbi:glucosylceramidase [Parabacteroides sp. PFB2-12]|uniref:glycoside hydrolase family 30 protein n=1 Tax=unclassified Parabacteroides TaxID=2649774 RepID=UPI0024762881|nr:MULTISPECIES: beta-glycosidase [unclassified Parabacteroides]MDH6343387.1 glucosylceramidase [Parabacteroides sp. PM6-13]MDH6390403.1 glucosylceramidase [Parabacteroides sp. PFB2-12]